MKCVSVSLREMKKKMKINSLLWWNMKKDADENKEETACVNLFPKRMLKNVYFWWLDTNNAHNSKSIQTIFDMFTYEIIYLKMKIWSVATVNVCVCFLGHIIFRFGQLCRFYSWIDIFSVHYTWYYIEKAYVHNGL